MRKPNPIARSLKLRQFKTKIVKPKKGKGSYRRKSRSLPFFVCKKGVAAMSINYPPLFLLGCLLLPSKNPIYKPLKSLNKNIDSQAARCG